MVVFRLKSQEAPIHFKHVVQQIGLRKHFDCLFEMYGMFFFVASLKSIGLEREMLYNTFGLRKMLEVYGRVAQQSEGWTSLPVVRFYVLVCFYFNLKCL